MPGSAVKEYEFQLRVSPEEWMEYYRGTIRHVLVRATTGQSLQFPSSLLQQFVTHSGIRGRFRLTTDERGKCLELVRL